MLTAAGIWGLLIETVMGMQPMLVPFRLLQVVGIATIVVCAISANRRAHAAAALLVVALFTISIAYMRYRLRDLAIAGG